MKEKILKLLREPGFVSGQLISKELGISRTAVWKYINALREEGYEIESVTRKGYRLLKSPDVLTADRLSVLVGPHVPGHLACYETIDSTNEEAKRCALQGAPDRSLYVAEVQTRGKGRRGRRWQSPGGKDLFFSILLRPEIPLESTSMITLVCAYAMVLTMEKYAKEKCHIKWPNDIVLHDKKICGILTEMSTELHQIQYVVAGIGANLNRTEFDAEIADMAGSILSEAGQPVNRGDFLRDFMAEFNQVYPTFLARRDLSFLAKDYNERLINIGRQVRLLGPGGKVEMTGTAQGINDRGELLVEDSEGTVHAVCSGEVSVRGLYGYV